MLIVLAAAEPTAAPAVFLENDVIRVEWDAARGTMVSLRDKATGREWLEPAADATGYAVRLVDESAPIVASGAKTVGVRKEGQAVFVETSHEEPAAMSITCRYWLEKESPSILGRISIRTPSPCRIDEVRFPLIPLRLPLSGDGEQDHLLLPYCDGYVIRNPAENRFDRRINYPGAASMQMMAIYDPAAGLLLSSRDTAAYAKSLCARQRGKWLELAIAHHLPHAPVTEWELGYDVALAGLRPSDGMTKITWEAAADVYRRWAEKQPWCRRTMAERVAAGDIPRWIVEPSLFLTFSLRGQTQEGTLGNRLPLVVEQFDRWRRLVGAPITGILVSWEKHDTWVAPDYFPPYGGEANFTAVTNKLQANGHRALAFLSGLNWTLHKDLAGPDRPHVVIDDEAEFNRRGRPWAISDAAGQAIVSGEPTSGVGQCARICPATPLAGEILLDASLRCQELGFDCVQVDQIVGGGMPACYHPQHDHPPGGGNWSAQTLYRRFTEIRNAGKARDPDFAFSIEEPGEYFLPILDTYHARDLHQGRWPRSGAGVLGVPLFTHVYHDFLPGYGSEGCYLSDKPSRLTLYQVGMNLVCGKTPAVALWGRWLEPEKADPVQCRLLRSHLDLWRGPAGDFLLYGQRVPSLELDVPAMEMTFTEKDGKTRRPLRLPSVLHSAWKLADGRTGTIYACIAENSVAFAADGETITLEPGQAVLRTGSAAGTK